MLEDPTNSTAPDGGGERLSSLSNARMARSHFEFAAGSAPTTNPKRTSGNPMTSVA
jgi:hypothetical protein